jgi:hypothetical protein
MATWLNVSGWRALLEKAWCMKELLRTTDIVLLSYVNSLLNGASIPALIADTHVSSVEGSIGAFPQRVLVDAEDWETSISLLTGAGLGAHLTAIAPQRRARAL